MPPVSRPGNPQDLIDWLEAEPLPVLVNEALRCFKQRSRCALAKNTLAAVEFCPLDPVPQGAAATSRLSPQPISTLPYAEDIYSAAAASVAPSSLGLPPKICRSCLWLYSQNDSRQLSKRCGSTRFAYFFLDWIFCQQAQKKYVAKVAYL